MWFKKDNRDKILDKLHELVKLIGTKLDILEGRVELIDGKLRKKIYKDVGEGDSDGEELHKEKGAIDDGFNELRAARKGL